MRLFSAIVKAFLKNAGNFASGLVGVPIAGDIVVDAWENWHKDTDERQRKAELESYARKQLDEVVAEARALVQREAPQLAAEMRAALAQYLTQVPATIRRNLRRPADHTGLTVPAGMALRSAHDLLKFLPLKLPRFQPGDKPLANSDLELLELLGQGGFGEVWKARHLDRPKLPPVALKFCLDAAAARSLKNELELLDHVASAGKHDGIVQLLNAHLRVNPPCLEYECIEGGDLAGVLAELHANGAADPKWVARVILHLAKIVAFAHSQNPAIVHRDLKPANILVRRRDEKLSFKITDFGIGGLWAREALHKLHTGQTKPVERKQETILGAYTPLYASPEQMGGAKPDPRDDVHALGIIWFQLQTGQLTLMSMPNDWRDDLVAAKMPGPLLELLASCIGKQERRPSNGGELAERLAAALGDGTTTPLPKGNTSEPRPPSPSGSRDHREGKVAPPPKPTAEVKEKPRSSISLMVLLPLVLLIGLVVMVGFWLANSGTKTPDEFINTLGMKFRLVRRGGFWMGGGGGKPGGQYQQIPQDFYMGVFTVTQGEWRALMPENPSPSYFSRTGDGKDKVKGFSDEELDRFPVEQVSWTDVQKFIEKLNAREKASGWAYRLPTEVQWEYSCRGGPLSNSKEDSSYNFYFDHPTNNLSWNQANFRCENPALPVLGASTVGLLGSSTVGLLGSSAGQRSFLAGLALIAGRTENPAGNGLAGTPLMRTTKVGSEPYRPNKLGLYDMHGNVWQWCEDLWDAKGSARVIRGGSSFYPVVGAGQEKDEQGTVTVNKENSLVVQPVGQITDAQFIDHIQQLLFNPTDKPGAGPFVHTQWGALVKFPSDPRIFVLHYAGNGPPAGPHAYTDMDPKGDTAEPRLQQEPEYTQMRYGPRADPAMIDPLDQPGDVGNPRPGTGKPGAGQPGRRFTIKKRNQP